ncbi:hypothetical protein OSG_eHP14_00120 [environmental Halophage eHP-14]|nr:hypothetical protein OSG_eHP14_00120 [environmental Halophage eHP-14]
MSASEDYEIQETPEEAKRNRGYVTVMEQTKVDENHDEGDRYLLLGYEEKKYKLVDEGTTDQGFIPVAVPIAHIELDRILDGQDEFGEWVNSDVGKLALAELFDDLQPSHVLTGWGEERDIFADGVEDE